MNKVQLIGKLGADPTIKNAGESKVCNISLATSDKKKDGTEVTDWHNLVFWNKAAEIIQKHGQKGTHLYVEGKLKTRSYETTDGSKKYVTEVVVTAFELLGNFRKPHVGGTDFRNDEPVQLAYETPKNGDPF